MANNYQNTNREFQTTKGVQVGFTGRSPLNLSLFLIIILLILLLILQKQISSSNFLHVVIELFGAFVVTFMGVYISINYTKKSDQEKERKEREKVYVGGLKLLASELRLNEQLLPPLNDTIDTIPDNPDKYYDNYGFILEMAHGIKTDVFYNLISSGTIHEISRSDDIFNKVQQAYYNIQGSINGISLSRKVFEDFADKPINTIPQSLIDMAKGIINNESQKLKRTIEMVRVAREEIEKELSAEYGVTFTNEFSIRTKGK